MKIKELMVKNVVTVPSNVPVRKAVKLMNKKRIGCLVVIDYGQITGILTERDILKRVVEEGKNPQKTKISQIMTKHVIVGNPNMELTEAAKLMFVNRVKKLPLVDGRHLVGLVTLTDIARVTSVDQKTVLLVEKLSNMHLIQSL